MPDSGKVTDVTERAYVWRADGRYRVAIGAVLVLLLALSAVLLVQYGYLAIIGVTLGLALVARTWWVLLRPSLTAGPDGVRVVHDWAPVHLAWTEIRRCEATPQGVKIIGKDGREVVARYPQRPAVPAAEFTEADAVADYLARRATWARKPTGPRPVYVAPPRPARAVRV